MDIAEAEQLDFESVLKETDKAYQIKFDGANIIWLPKSQTRILEDIIYVPAWLVEAKGLKKFLITQ